MKKIIFCFVVIVAITASIISCDTRKFGKEALPQPAVLIDSIAFEIVKVSSDTIKSYQVRNALYTLTLKAFDKDKKEIKDTKVPIKIKFLLDTGVNKINNTSILYDSNLVTDKPYSINYIPNAQKNGYNIFVYSSKNHLGEIFTDTVKYYVFKYNPIEFTITGTPTNIGLLRPTSSSSFTINLNSKDVTNQMSYKIKFFLPSSSITVYNSQGNIITDAIVLPTGDNKYTVKLLGHSVGTNYNIRITATDLNGDERNIIISYDVVGNMVPVITNAKNTNSIEYILTNHSFGPVTIFHDGCRNYNYLLNNYNLFENFHLDINEDQQILAVKIRVVKPSGADVILSYATSVKTSYDLKYSNGVVQYSYPQFGWQYGASWCSFSNTINLYGGDPGLSNNGENVMWAKYSNTIPFGSVCYISVKDNDGAWSNEFKLPINDDGVKTGPLIWRRD